MAEIPPKPPAVDMLVSGSEFSASGITVGNARKERALNFLFYDGSHVIILTRVSRKRLRRSRLRIMPCN